MIAMRYPSQHKAETRKKILTAAARLFRERGYDGVGVDAIMNEVGLTAGGFYAHFSSKEALFAEAVTTALGRGQALRAAKSASIDPTDSLRALINGYLNRTHRDMVGEGCPLPVLTPDVARSDASTRESYEQQFLHYLSEIEALLPQGSTASHDRALAFMAQCVGGLMLARAVKDEQLSNRILKACRQAATKICEQ
jgi:TetR/AcrR family transcriptional regulator, transcriptional repressor for nem operon